MQMSSQSESQLMIATSPPKPQRKAVWASNLGRFLPKENSRKPQPRENKKYLKILLSIYSALHVQTIGQ